ncbi:MAG TPA: hypothetical protein VK781_14650 [Solirubrobacteraceae bacterium]|jgi:hypothetical protein|nr:hypothetical protein [Solirubrobacteraceae bacterium]
MEYFLALALVVVAHDNGSKIVATLKYQAGESLRLIFTLSGCPVAKREHVTRSAMNSAGDRLTSELERLTSSAK